jgi:hypothetical protein
VLVASGLLYEACPLPYFGSEGAAILGWFAIVLGVSLCATTFVRRDSRWLLLIAAVLGQSPVIRYLSVGARATVMYALGLDVAATGMECPVATMPAPCIRLREPPDRAR